jgi:transposase
LHDTASTLKPSIAQADIDAGVKGGLTSTEQNHLIQLRCRNRRLEQENETLRCAAASFAAESRWPAR